MNSHFKGHIFRSVLKGCTGAFMNIEMAKIRGQKTNNTIGSLNRNNENTQTDFRRISREATSEYQSLS